MLFSGYYFLVGYCMLAIANWLLIKMDVMTAAQRKAKTPCCPLVAGCSMIQTSFSCSRYWICGRLWDLRADQRYLLVVLGFLESLADQEDPERSQPCQIYCLMTKLKLEHNNFWKKSHL